MRVMDFSDEDNAPRKSTKSRGGFGLKKLKSTNRFKVTVVVHGGGKSGQAGAIKHGIARTLVDFDQNFRKKLKKSGYLTRDPRAKERRKYGLKKARKAPRWAKR